ncbi:MAG: hypothetical protein ONB12_04075 [candidate division KSB1 bacterium]|nr:hypothetical protein [candidate division KSB1 bacterium]
MTKEAYGLTAGIGLRITADAKAVDEQQQNVVDKAKLGRGGGVLRDDQ